MSERQNSQELRPAILRRIEGDGRARRLSLQEEKSESEDINILRSFERRLSVASLTTAALVGLGLAAVEAARIALAYEALAGWFGSSGNNSLTALPLAAVLTLGLAALDAGLLLRLFIPSTAGRNDSWATWAAIGAWLLATTAVTWLGMYALTGMLSNTKHVSDLPIADFAPVAVAVVLLVLRLLLVGALAADSKSVLGERS